MPKAANANKYLTNNKIKSQNQISAHKTSESTQAMGTVLQSSYYKGLLEQNTNIFSLQQKSCTSLIAMQKKFQNMWMTAENLQVTSELTSDKINSCKQAPFIDSELQQVSVSLSIILKSNLQIIETQAIYISELSLEANWHSRHLV